MEYIIDAYGNKFEIENITEVGTNLVRIIFYNKQPETVSMSYFVLYSRGGYLLRTFIGYNTLYRRQDKTLTFSNDGSVYVEKPADNEGIYEELPLESQISMKVSQLSDTCQQMIFKGIDVTFNDSDVKHFSLTLEDQISLLGMILDPSIDKYEYHADGEPCEYFTYEQMTKIAMAAKQHVAYHKTYFNSLAQYVKSIKTVEELQTVYYDMPVPEEYQSEVLKQYLAQA